MGEDMLSLRCIRRMALKCPLVAFSIGVGEVCLRIERLDDAHSKQDLFENWKRVDPTFFPFRARRFNRLTID